MWKMRKIFKGRPNKFKILWKSDIFAKSEIRKFRQIEVKFALRT